MLIKFFNLLFLAALCTSCGNDKDESIENTKTPLSFKFEKTITVKDAENTVAATYLIRSTSQEYLDKYVNNYNQILVKKPESYLRSSATPSEVSKENDFLSTLNGAKEAVVVELIGDFPEGYLLQMNQVESMLRGTEYNNPLFKYFSFNKKKYGETMVYFTTGATLQNNLESSGYIFMDENTYGWYAHPNLYSNVVKSLTLDSNFITMTAQNN